MVKGQKGMGWLCDYPDIRDYTIFHDEVSQKSKEAGVMEPIVSLIEKTGIFSVHSDLPFSMDLREYCSPVEDQGMIGSCTANACVGMLEYFENKAFGKHIDASRLFLYKTTRNILQRRGDFGAYIRTTMMAMVLFGVVPEKYWPYVEEDFDMEPDSFCYSFARNYQTLQYFRLDCPPNSDPSGLLLKIKKNLAASLPLVFGFSVYSSYLQADQNGGKIPYPSKNEKMEGGHAVMAVGYDDGVIIRNSINGEQTTGALLIRNSWGKQWGEGGYGWLPYAFITSGLAIDWWCLLESRWIDTGNFKVD
jgi:C1A family cysteine protease